MIYRLVIEIGLWRWFDDCWWWWWYTTFYHVNATQFFLIGCCFLLWSSKQCRFCWSSKWCAASCHKWHFNLFGDDLILTLVNRWLCVASDRGHFVLDVGKETAFRSLVTVFNGGEMIMMGWCTLCLHVTDDIVIVIQFRC